MQHSFVDILDGLEEFYSAAEFPVLLEQCREWSKSRPFEGKRLLDGTPVYRNTFAKYAALLAGGAELYVPHPDIMPHDPEILAKLPEYGISVIDPAAASVAFDVVLDCAGNFSRVPSRYGYVELTKSGGEHYRHSSAPVYMVDDSLIKHIETCLGTGESFFRAMCQLNHTDWHKGPLLVIGYGKVGQGIVINALEQGIQTVVSDIAPKQKDLPPGIPFVPADDRAAFNSVLRNAYCAVTATGTEHAMQRIADPSVVATRPVLLANMGVDDEWGPNIPAERVLNGRKPLNFILDDPTSMCFIDPPLALHNAGALELISNDHPPGMFPPPAALEEDYMNIIRAAGLISADLLSRLTAHARHSA